MGVARVEGVPVWFTALLHWINVRHCHREGHVVPASWDWSLPIVCTQCGLILDPR